MSDTITSVDSSPYGIFEELYRLGMTDGLPVIPPEPYLVREFVAASGREADEVIGYLNPSGGAATVEKIAVNAVLAGCRPEYMPTLLALVEALADVEFNLHGQQTTTSPGGPMVILNGPIRLAYDVNCGRNLLGPGRRANATIGRFCRLAQLNIGGAIPGETDLAIHGMPGKYTFCFGEFEEESPWAPLHVDRGLLPSDSAVTVIGVQGTLDSAVTYTKAESIFTIMGNSIASWGSQNFLVGKGQVVIIMNTGTAKMLARLGYSKRQIQVELFHHGSVRHDSLPEERSTYAFEDNFVVDGDWIRPVRRPEDLVIVVGGGPEPYHVMICPSFGDTTAVTVRVPI